MEDVLEVYTRPYDPCRPQVCMDETSKQLLRDTRQALPMEPGRTERTDYEYERGGVVNLFMFMEPLTGRRWVDVTEHRTKTEWAHRIKELVDLRYPEAEQIVLVMDNLNTHTPASLYEAFDPAEARRIAKKLEIHYTPKHGSWLNSRRPAGQTRSPDPKRLRRRSIRGSPGWPDDHPSPRRRSPPRSRRQIATCSAPSGCGT